MNVKALTAAEASETSKVAGAEILYSRDEPRNRENNCNVIRSNGNATCILQTFLY